MPITLICLDADDTLWHHGNHYEATEARFAALLAPYALRDAVAARLSAVEQRNLGSYGYGAKSFTLSMIETALELGGDAATLTAVLAAGRDMIAHPIELLPGVEQAIARLARIGRLVLVTKGDLFLQEAKLAASGLADRFAGVEIVSDKTADTYRRIFRRYGAEPAEVVMAGNSVRSDILPVLEAGAHAALVPYDVVWSHEAADAPQDHPRFREVQTLGAAADWIMTIV